MGYLKYQLEGEQISFGNGEWFFTGDKRKSDKVVGRYTSSESCEGQCNACNIVTARYSNGETYSIPYDCNAANSHFNADSLFEINDYLPVSAITSLEFGDCVTRIDGTLSDTPLSFDSLTSITFSNSSSLKAIGESFYGVKAPQLTEIRFPSSFKFLDNKAFAWNTPNLERVFLNDGIKWIGSEVFTGTKIRELVIPSTVVHLGTIKFSSTQVDKLRKVIFINETPPKSLGGDWQSELLNGAVYVPCGSVNKYKQAFHNASWYDFEERVTCEGAPFRIKYTMSDGFNVALPCNDGYVGSGDTKDFLDDDVVNIEFSECTKTINTQFSGFTSLHDVDLTIQNAEINYNAFNHTSGITSLTIKSGCTFVSSSAFANMPDLKIVKLEEGLTDLGESMFDGCTSLSSITIPNGVTRITGGMLKGCTSLSSITIPNSVTSIYYTAFSGCTSLSSITIPNGVTGIGKQAFANCSSLTKVVMPSSITEIGARTFANCTSLANITIEAITPPTLYDTNAFENTNNCPIYVPCDSVNSYINSWRSLSARIRGIEPCNLEMMVYVTYIESSGLNDYIKYCDDTDMYIPNVRSAETVTYGDCVTSIGNQAFKNKKNLKSVTIPNSVTSIGQQAFQGCTSLTSIDIPDSVTSIGIYAFDSCIRLLSVTIGSGVTSIGNNAFDYCTGLTSVTINATTPPTIGTSVFASSNCPIYVPAASVNAYKTASGWSEYADRIQPIPNS